MATLLQAGGVHHFVVAPGQTRRVYFSSGISRNDKLIFTTKHTALAVSNMQ